MAAETAESTHAQATPARWKKWLQLAGAALLLLVVSEALWIWQTWPVRELLQPAPATRATETR
jgi:hypothetical protein